MDVYYVVIGHVEEQFYLLLPALIRKLQRPWVNLNCRCLIACAPVIRLTFLPLNPMMGPYTLIS